MNSKKKLLKNSRLYLILDKTACGRKNTQKMLTDAIKGGIDIVQIRDKTSSTRIFTQSASILKKIAKKYHIPFIINDRVDIALAIDADGVHLGQNDLPARLARKLLGKDKIIGLSTHNLKQVVAAQKEPIDYLGFGPVFKTATKPDLAPKGIKMLKSALKISGLPIFPIGGIEEITLSAIINKNVVINRAAVCRPICKANNPRRSARVLKNRLTICTHN